MGNRDIGGRLVHAAVLIAVALSCGGARASASSNREDTKPPPMSAASAEVASSTDSGAPGIAELTDGTEWHGSFTITLEVWNYCGSPPGSLELSLADTYERTERFSFSTAAPTEDPSGARERNPFYVSAGTDTEEPGVVNLTMFSAGLVSFDENDEPFLVQYWELDYSDGRLTGELVEDGRELGAAFNAFYDENPLVPCQPEQFKLTQPYPMQEGASLVADLGPTLMTMLVEGRSFDESRRWRVEAVATRS